ncbi:777_t:CDS:2, partial [Cetraspora pellucida]
TNNIIEGLLAAAFGNIIELIILIFALIHREIEIVQTSLLGSIISNLLLILEMCILVSGYYFDEQKFKKITAQTNSRFTKNLNISKSFVSIIILPIVRNVAEHFTAMDAARKNKMDLAISISVGSSMDGKSNWLEGVIENNIECEYSIIKTEEKFLELKKIGLSAYVVQLEYTSDHKVHVQAYFKMKSSMESNVKYARKHYNKCKKHEKKRCKCHYSEDEDYICELKSRIDGLASLIGPFQFGIFHNLEKNEILLENLKRVENIRKENMLYEEIIMNADTKAPLSWHQAPNGFEKIRKDMKYFKKLKRGGRFWCPVVFYFYGPGGSKKSRLVTELFGNELFDKQEKIRSSSSW